MFQFIHTECYAREAGKDKKGGHTIDSIALEADRVEGNFPHVAEPKKPNLIYGCSAQQAANLAKNWAENSKDTSGRKLRKDGLCLLAGVISYKNDGPDWEKFKADAVQWLQKKYGKDRLKSVVEHTDETHPHLHFYVVPRAGERFESIHDGRQAAQVAKVAGQLKGAQNAAYKAAMEAFQGEFSHDVAMAHGMTRLGPKRRRLTREEWHQEQKQAQFFADARAQKSAIRKKARAAAQKEADEIVKKSQELGERVKNFTAIFKGPNKASLEAVAAANAKLAASEERAQKAQKELEERLKTRYSQEREALQKELDKQKRIAASYEQDLRRYMSQEEIAQIKRSKGLTR